MARRSSALAYECLSVEGGLFPAEWFSQLAQSRLPQMAAEDYGLPAGLQLRDEVSRAWTIARAWWHRYTKAREGLAPESPQLLKVTTTFTVGWLREALGFQSLQMSSESIVVRERHFPLTATALAGHVPILVAGCHEPLDAPLERLKEGRRRSPFGLMQEYLNATDTALWGIVANGRQLRLLRDNAALTRPSWLEVDLERLFTAEHHADFAALWLLLHESRFGIGTEPPEDCWLEQQRIAALNDGTRAREKLRHGVTQALRELGEGFLRHPANETLREGLRTGHLQPEDFFAQLLRLVYRLIFIVTVEERGLLHPPGTDGSPARQRYTQGFALLALRERAARALREDVHHDLWLRLQVVVRGLATGQDALALPPLGGLFEATQCPQLDAAHLDNGAFLAALRALTWVPLDRGLARVNWRDMGSEEFGSIYESLLELVPLVRLGEVRPFRLGEVTEGTEGNARKRSGSYYTPDSLVQCLLDSALEPVIAQRVLPLVADPERAAAELLSLSVVDPACGSGHFLLGAARRLASHLARLRTDGAPSAAEYRSALRQVVTHCIFGTDRNPLAIELARMTLWLEATTPEAPLGYLDHHLRHADALLGLIDLGVLSEGIPDAAYEALAGDEPAVARRLKQRNRRERESLETLRAGGPQFELLPSAPLQSEAWEALEQMADSTPEQLQKKRQCAEALTTEAGRSGVKLAADFYVAAFLLPKQEGPEFVPTTQHVLSALQGQPVSALIREAVDGLLRREPVSHWRLLFPQVFARGGFDVVIGNPPWEKIKLAEKEFFTSRAPDIANAPNAAARRQMIRALAEAQRGSVERALHDAYVLALHAADGFGAWLHAADRFEFTGRGDVNLYAVFAETMLRLSGARGRAGLIVPTGIATDDSTKVFFGEISTRGRIASLFDFENREGLFADVDSRMKFSLLTLGHAAEAEFIFYATQTGDLRDARRKFRLSPADFSLLNPNTLTCPVFRSERDAELTRKIYGRVPVLINERKPGKEGNPWGVSFMTMFHMSNDSGLFYSEPAPDRLPLYEAKMIHQYDHRWATYVSAHGEPKCVDATLERKRDPDFEATPRYWVEKAEVESRLATKGWAHQWLVGWRDICRATDERTVIASVMPLAGVGNKIPLMFPAADYRASSVALLLGSLSALVLDFCARQKIGGTTLNYFYMKQFPILPPAAFDQESATCIVPRIAELSFTSEKMRPWAGALGRQSVAAFDPERRAALRGELDAWYAHLYGLTRDELRYVLDPTDTLGADFPSETFRVLKKNEIAAFGEYRTARLVLEAWDRIIEPLRRARGRP